MRSVQRVTKQAMVESSGIARGGVPLAASRMGGKNRGDNGKMR